MLEFFESWKKEASKREKFIIFNTCITFFFTVISVGFALQNTIILQMENTGTKKCDAETYMGVYSSFSFLEFLGMLYSICAFFWGGKYCW